MSEEWAVAAPYLILFTLDASQRRHDPRKVLNALRSLAHSGCPCRMLPNDLPPWSLVYQQTQRWLKGGCSEAMVHHGSRMVPLADGRAPDPPAVVLDGRTLQSAPTRGARAGYDGARRNTSATAHMVVDTLGHLFALHVSPANEQDGNLFVQLAQVVQESTSRLTSPMSITVTREKGSLKQPKNMASRSKS